MLRGGHGEAEEGEDVDLSAPTDWRTVLPLVGAFVANILLIDWLGWVDLRRRCCSGACAWALGSRHTSVTLASRSRCRWSTFYGFYVGLGIPLPAGILEGML